MILRRRSIDVSQLEECIKRYLDFSPQLLEKRQHYALLQVLNFVKGDLGVSSIVDLLKMDVKVLILSLQRYVNKAASGELTGKPLSSKSIRFNVYLARSFFSFYNIEINPKKIRVPRKSGKSRIDRIPSLAELQKLVLGTKSPRMRLIIMLMALCGLRLSEALSIKREWIDIDRGYIVLPSEATKVGRSREIPMPLELKHELKRYLENYPYERGYLFCVKDNPEKRIPKGRFYENYIELLKRLGLDSRTPDGSSYSLHPHVFRKWYRTQLESAGVNKLLIDLWMGHNSGIEKLYYLPTYEMIKSEFEKADKALRIFGAMPQTPPLTEEKLKALEDAIEFYETLMNRIVKNNPGLLKILGLE